MDIAKQGGPVNARFCFPVKEFGPSGAIALIDTVGLRDRQDVLVAGSIVAGLLQGVKDMIRETLSNAQKDAMKARDTARLSTVRLILAAIKDKDIANRGLGKEQASEDEILQLLAKMIKQREESVKIYIDGGRPELADKEREEIAVIQGFMPEQLSEEKVREICVAIVAELGAQGLKDMGKCVAALRERYAGQMDFAKASAILKELLK